MIQQAFGNYIALSLIFSTWTSMKPSLDIQAAVVAHAMHHHLIEGGHHLHLPSIWAEDPLWSIAIKLDVHQSLSQDSIVWTLCLDTLDV